MTTPALAKGDVVRPKWGQRSGRWLVLSTDDNPWHLGWVRVRCTRVPRRLRKRRWDWRVGQEGWVIFKLERIDP